MEYSYFNINGMDFLFFCLLLLMMLSVFICVKKGLLNGYKILYVINECVPWLFILWFAVGLVDCVGAASNIGSGNSEVSIPLFWGIFAGPVLFIISIFVRKYFRQRYFTNKK